MQYNTLLARIAADIYSNGAELITGDLLQNVLNDMVGALASAGACYKGTITPASAAPLDLDQPTVYLALTAGTYTNFVDSNNDPIVTTGPALITYDGGPSLVFTKTDLPSGSPDAVLYTPQTLTDPQKTQARENIEAAHAVRITSADLSSEPYLYILIPYDSQELNLRIDVVAHNSSGDKIGYTGSLLLALNDGGGGVWTGKQAYYYGDDLALLFSSIAIDVYGDYSLVLACESSNDDITLTIYPTTDTEIAATWYASRPGTEEDTITPTVIGAGGGSDVFWATYGTTTAAEIATAIAANKVVMCVYGQSIYELQLNNPDYYAFYSLIDSSNRLLYCYTLNSVWTNSSVALERTSNKKTDIPANRTSETYYPNTKGVFDLTSKWGVISQTQTWSGTGSNPRTYTIDPASIVRGIIPQANIDLFESAGAVFDATSGYFQLNGLTDISYEEMRKIYAVSSGATFGLKDRSGIYAMVKTRTVLPLYGSGQAAFTYTMSTVFYKSGVLDTAGVETIGFNVYSDTTDKSFYVSSLVNTFYDCHLLREINGILNVYNISTAQPGTFTHCYSLENLNLYKIKTSYLFPDSPNLTLTSVVYMVQNAINTSAITITLHATAYARCQADTTEYTYQGNTYTGILALATAKNISIGQA